MRRLLKGQTDYVLVVSIMSIHHAVGSDSLKLHGKSRI